MYAVISLSVKLIDDRTHEERMIVNFKYDSENNIQSLKSEVIAKTFDLLIKEGIKEYGTNQ